MCWNGLFFFNIRCKNHGFWLVYLHQLEVRVCAEQHPYDPAYIPKGQVTKWWFHFAVPLVCFLLIVQVVTFKMALIWVMFPRQFEAKLLAYTV